MDCFLKCKAVTRYNFDGECHAVIRIKERGLKLQPTNGFPATGASAPSDPNGPPDWVSDGSGPLRET